MKSKKILIICLIICFIFSIHAVSSADIDLNDTLTTSDADVLTENNDFSIQATPESDDVLGAGEGSFSDLQSDIPTTGTIELTKNYTFDETVDSGITDGILITDSVIIDGKGIVTIDAKNKARIFNIVDGATVTLRGITFINGNGGASNGGAIYSSGTIHV